MVEPIPGCGYCGSAGLIATIVQMEHATEPIRVALVEDSASVRARLVERFRFFDSVQVSFCAPTGEDFLRMMDECAPELMPQVILMDIEMPGMDGIEAARRAKERWPDVDILVFTVFEDDEKIFDAITAGAAGYLLKDATADHIVGSIIEMRHGGAPMSPSVARRVLGFVNEKRRSDRKAADEFELSDRETEILQHLVEGQTEHFIAGELHISPHTVRTHVKNIYKKLHVHSRASAVRVALRKNLIRK